MNKWFALCVAACNSLLLGACTAKPATSAVSSGSSTTTTAAVIPAAVEEIGEYSFGDSLEEVTFLGYAPSKLRKLPFNDQATIYYNKHTQGREDTSLRNGRYTLIAR